MADLKGAVCLVTGATRGIGRGIATQLGKSGATVYITGRNLKPTKAGIRGSLEETSSEIENSGGKAIPVVVDHTKDEEIERLFQKIDQEQQGRLDILINNAYSAAQFLLDNIGKTYYQIDSFKPGDVWDIVNNAGLRNHYICCVLGTRMMIKYQHKLKAQSFLRPGLIVNISSMGGERYLFNTVYGTGKAALERMSCDMAYELKGKEENICIVSLRPGVVRTEFMIQANNENKLPFPLDSAESPELVGDVVVALALESHNKLMSRSGKVIRVSNVLDEKNMKIY